MTIADFFPSPVAEPSFKKLREDSERLIGGFRKAFHELTSVTSHPFKSAALRITAGVKERNKESARYTLISDWFEASKHPFKASKLFSPNYKFIRFAIKTLETAEKLRMEEDSVLRRNSPDLPVTLNSLSEIVAHRFRPSKDVSLQKEANSDLARNVAALRSVLEKSLEDAGSQFWPMSVNVLKLHQGHPETRRSITTNLLGGKDPQILVAMSAVIHNILDKGVKLGVVSPKEAALHESRLFTHFVELHRKESHKIPESPDAEFFARVSKLEIQQQLGRLLGPSATNMLFDLVDKLRTEEGKEPVRRIESLRDQIANAPRHG